MISSRLLETLPTVCCPTLRDSDQLIVYTCIQSNFRIIEPILGFSESLERDLSSDVVYILGP